MTENDEKHITQKLVNQTVLLHALKKYDLHDYYIMPILDECMECYYGDRAKFSENKIIDGVKREIDITIMMKILSEIRAMTDDEFKNVANNIYEQFEAFNITKKKEIENLESHHKEHKLNELAKKNNAYLHLCEVFSIMAIERIFAKGGDLSILNGMSTGMLKFILKTALEKETKNEIEFHFNSEDWGNDPKAVEEHSEYEQIISQVETALKERHQITNDETLHNYEEQIKQEEKHRLEQDDE